MTDNVTEFRKPDMVEAMKGPETSGCAVILEGHRIPNLQMIDNGASVSFLLDNRFIYDIPREMAWQVADFVATAMAVGAGYPHYRHGKNWLLPYAVGCVGISPDVAG